MVAKASKSEQKSKTKADDQLSNKKVALKEKSKDIAKINKSKAQSESS